jgi:hypothetical protein
MATQNLRIHYRGSLFWLIFWIIIFFPVALVLFFTGADFVRNGVTHHLQYDGSRFWLCFWVIFFFPIAFLLFFLNGFSFRTTE